MKRVIDQARPRHRAERRHRHAHVGLVGAAAVLLLWVDAGSSAAVDGPQTLWTGFESGDSPSWSEDQGIDISSDYAHTGTYGAQATATPDQAAYLKWGYPTVTQGQRYARIGGWFRIDSAEPDESVGVFSVKNDVGVNNFDFFLNPVTGRFQWDLYRYDNASSTMTAELGKWYYVEAIVDFGGPWNSRYTARVRINGVDQPAITSDLQVGSTVRSAFFGGPAIGKTNTREYDSLSLWLSDDPQDMTW
jgi:hypothetical protein